MKQAQRWLLIITASLLLPSVAHAQPKKPVKTTPPVAGAPAGEQIELDDPGKPAAAASPTTASPTSTSDPNAATGGTGPGGGGGICEIDPTACPKQLDIGATAKKEINAEVYAVQQIYALRYHRLELQPDRASDSTFTSPTSSPSV